MRVITLVLLVTAFAAPVFAQNSLELVWTGYGEAANNYFGAGITGGDFNNDGYSDVLIGAGGWEQGIGRNYLYFGTQEFFTEATMFFQGDSTFGGFDNDISNVGDVNVDEIDDFLIPAAGAINGGWVELYYGGELLDTIPDWRVDKDSQVMFSEFFGGSTDSIGDVNGDGWGDFIISGGGYAADSTYFEIYFGGDILDTIPDIQYITYSYPNYWLIVEGLGDINGDGFDDVLAYKPVSSSVTTYPVQIFFGGPNMDAIPDLEIIPYAICAGGVGDVNNDGYNDFAIYKRFCSNPIELHTVVYFGAAEVDTFPDVVLEGLYTPDISCSDGFSHADVNGDGISDIICEGGWDFPYLYVYLGSPWFNGTPDWWYAESWMYDGIRVSGVGDVNGDGCDEVALGIPYYSYLSPNKGEAHLFAGNPDLVDLGAPVEPEDLPQTPGWYKLDQNYPNPFNASTSIHFELGKPSTVNLTIYDLQGNRIRQLITAKPMLPGGYNISWNGRDQSNQPVSSGVYLLEFQVDQFTEVMKMVMMK